MTPPAALSSQQPPGHTRCALCTSGLLRRSPHLISPCRTLCPMPWRSPDRCAISGLPRDFLPSFRNASSQEGAATQELEPARCSHFPGQPLSLQGWEAGVIGTQPSAWRHSVRVPRDSSALASDNPRRRAAEGRVPPRPPEPLRPGKGARSYVAAALFPALTVPPPSGGNGGSLRHPRARGTYLSGEHRGRGPRGPHPAPRLRSADPTLTAPGGGPDREPPAGLDSTIRSAPRQHRGRGGLLGSTR